MSVFLKSIQVCNQYLLISRKFSLKHSVHIWNGVALKSSVMHKVGQTLQERDPSVWL